MSTAADAATTVPAGPRARMHRFVGVDLGGGRGKTTAVARLEHTEHDGQWRLVLADAKLRYGQRGTGSDEPAVVGDVLFRDEVLVDYLERWTDARTIVAIDAPLTLPACIRCTLACPGVERCEVPVVAWMRQFAPQLRRRGRSDPGKPAVTPYTQRATELLHGALGVQPREALGQGTGPLAARAAFLRRRLSPRLRLHENLIEVEPAATLQQWLGPERTRALYHGDTSRIWEQRKRSLHALAQGLSFEYVWPEMVVRNVHVFHAVVCALTASLWAAGQELTCEAVAQGEQGDPTAAAAAAALGTMWLEDGWIAIPRRPRPA